MYLLYPTTVGGYAIFEIPSGQTAEEVATSFGLTMAQCAEFDMADFDAGSVNFPYNFTLIDNQPLPNGAAFDLTGAKGRASQQEKSKFDTLELAASVGYSTNQLSSQASLPAVDRLPEIQVVLDAVNVLAVELSNDLAAIAAATNITEVNNIVNPPTGTLFTGRGSGLGPEDLNISYYTAFNSASMTEAETELYIPGTNITISYGSGGPNTFDSMGNAFNPGDYLMQIREVATSSVIFEFECPLNPSGENVVF